MIQIMAVTTGTLGVLLASLSDPAELATGSAALCGIARPVPPAMPGLPGQIAGLARSRP